jgi:death on curing protein
MSNESWRWVEEDAVLAIHDEQIAEHGGLGGIRDKALLFSALARPQHPANYENPDIAALAASYAVGIARNHPFLDGNKRTAFVVAAGVFLPLNGYQLKASNTDKVRVMLSVADRTMSESEFDAWLRANIAPTSAG